MPRNISFQSLRGRQAALAAVPLTMFLAACNGAQSPTPAQPVTVTVTSHVTVTVSTPPDAASTSEATSISTPTVPSRRPQILEGESDGLFLHLLSVSKKPSITYTGDTISDVTPQGKDVTIKARNGDYYLYVQVTGKNGTKHPIDLTCGYPLQIAVFDTTGAEYTPIESLSQISGNPGCNDETQPGQSFKETFIFLMPKDSKPAQLRWTSVSPELQNGPVATIDL